jgi:hypothetical protein
MGLEPKVGAIGMSSNNMGSIIWERFSLNPSDNAGFTPSYIVFSALLSLPKLTFSQLKEATLNELVLD